MAKKDEDALEDDPLSASEANSYSTIKWHGGGDVGELYQYSVLLEPSRTATYVKYPYLEYPATITIKIR